MMTPAKDFQLSAPQQDGTRQLIHRVLCQSQGRINAEWLFRANGTNDWEVVTCEGQYIGGEAKFARQWLNHRHD
jgi:hypothetical protein